MSQIKSQCLGLILGLATAIGCLVYERLVKEFSYSFMLLIFMFEVLLLWIAGTIIFEHDLKSDFVKFISDWKYCGFALIYVLTGITSLLWYKIARAQGVMVGSIYEVKYIIMLAVLYILFGQQKMTVNTIMGICFAMCSIWFISKK